MSKEQNFISAVVYIKDDNQGTIHFFDKLNGVLSGHFIQYEIIGFQACFCPSQKNAPEAANV